MGTLITWIRRWRVTLSMIVAALGAGAAMMAPPWLFFPALIAAVTAGTVNLIQLTMAIDRSRTASRSKPASKS